MRLRAKLLHSLRRYPRTLAEDVAHEALASLMAARDRLQEAAAINGYVFIAARRIRARELSRPEVSVGELDECRLPARMADQLESERLDVVKLAERRRSRSTEAVLAYYLEGWRAPEIARKQGVSESTIRSRIRHGLAQLRAEVGHENRRAHDRGPVAW